MTSTKQHSKLDFYLRTAMAGGICASAAHTVLVPIDVVKTRIQVKDRKANSEIQSIFDKLIN